jgi:hypothetical protein
MIAREFFPLGIRKTGTVMKETVQEDPRPLPHPVAGLVTAGILIVFSLVLQFTDMSRNQGVAFLGILLLVVSIAFFVYSYAKAVGGERFGVLFTYGFKATAVATLVMIAFQVVFFLIFPEYQRQMFEIAREQMAKQGQLTGDQVEQALESMKKFFWPMVIGGTLFNYIVGGAIGALLGAGLAPKREPRAFE